MRRAGKKIEPALLQPALQSYPRRHDMFILIRGSCCKHLQTKAITKGMHKSSMDLFGSGLEVFVPSYKMKPGDPEELVPASVFDRPMLTAAPCLQRKYGNKLIE